MKPAPFRASIPRPELRRSESFSRSFASFLLVLCFTAVPLCRGGDVAGDLHTLNKAIVASEKIVWVFMGDSVTQGAVHTKGWRNYSELFAERLRWEMNQRTMIVINTASSGSTLPGPRGLEGEALHFHPGVVSLMYGINDCLTGEVGREPFQQKLVRIVAAVRKAGAIPILHTPNPVLSSDRKRADLPAYVARIRAVAKSENIILVDHYAHWQSAKPREDDLLLWLNDEQHPNHLGHREIAKETFRALGIYSSDSATCQLSSAP
jgi:acyl-CoA thioesterase-1